MYTYTVKAATGPVLGPLVDVDRSDRLLELS